MITRFNSLRVTGSALIALALLALSACAPAPAGPGASPATVTPVAAAPTVAATAEPTAEAPTTEPAAAPSETPEVVTTGEAPAVSLPGDEAIAIKAASHKGGSVHVEGEAAPAFEQNLVVRVLDDAGQALAQAPATIQAEAGQRGPFSADVPVTATGAVLVQVYSTSARDGGITHLASAWLDAPNPAPASTEAIVITAPPAGATIAGRVTVAGQADPTFEQTLLVQVYDADGKLLGQASGHITADAGKRGPFVIQVPFAASGAGPGRVTVSATSPRNGATVHLSSVEVQIEK